MILETGGDRLVEPKRLTVLNNVLEAARKQEASALKSNGSMSDKTGIRLSSVMSSQRLLVEF